MIQSLLLSLSLLTAPQRRGLLLVLLSSALGAVVQTATILSMMPFILLLTNPELQDSNELLRWAYEQFGAESYPQFLGYLGLVAIVILMAGNVFVAFEQWFAVRFFNLLSHDLRSRMLRRILRRSYQQDGENHTAVLSDVLLNQISRLIDGVMGTSVAIFSSLAVAVLIVAALLLISLKTTLVTLFGLLIAYAAVFLLLRRRIEEDGAQATRLGASAFTAIGETLDGLREIKTRRAEGFFMRRFDRVDLQRAKLDIHHSMMEFLPHYVLETAVFTGFVAVALYFLFTTADAGVSLSFIALYGMAIYRLVPAMKGIFEGLASVHHNADAARVVCSQLGNDAPQAVPQAVDLPRREIRLESVGFSYPGTDRQQLKALELTIPIASSVCLFGPSGCGKSTVLNLIAGLLSPSAGRVTCDGVVIDTVTLDSWRSRIGYAPQHVYLFADTLASNIAFGVERTDIDLQRVMSVARLANLHEFVVTQLPAGYETVLAENGDSLSGGQRHRVGIARTLYHDPAVMLFDESFANLDATNRKEILDRLFAMTGKTLVFSSHEVGIASRCDNVVVIDGGKVIAEGRYQDLLQDSPRFVELLAFMRQAQGVSVPEDKAEA